MSRKKVFYMCGVDWQHELGETDGAVYPDEKWLRKATKCWDECGIVKVTVDESNIEWTYPQDFSKIDKSISTKDLEAMTKAQKNARERKHLEERLQTAKDAVATLANLLEKLN